MTSAERKLLLPFLRQLASGEVRAPFAEQEAKELIERFDRKPSIKKRAFKKRRKQKQIMERQSSGRAMTALRVAVFLRATNRCELCGFNIPTELHHLESGNGRRVQKQAVANCMAVCLLCHREYHADPFAFVGRVADWAARYKYPLRARIEHAALARPGNARNLKGESP